MLSPDAIPPAPDGYLRRVLRQGSTPFRYRSGVRTLLGMPANEDAVVGAASMPSIEFPYAVSPSLAAMAAPDLLAADRWVEAALNDLDSDKGRNPSTPRADTVESAPPPRSGQGPPTLAPEAAHPQVTPADTDASGSWGSITGRMGRAERERSETHHSPGRAEPMGFAALRSALPILQQDRADTVGAAPPPRSGQGPPTLAPEAAHPQVTPADTDASGSWGSITGRMGRAERERSETHHSPGRAETMGFAALRSALPILQQDRADTVESAPPPRSGQGPVAIAPRAALPQVTLVDLVSLPTLVSPAGALPSEASLGGPDGGPGSAARTYNSSLQSAGFTAVPAAMDNRKVGPSVVPTPMPLADALPGIGITASAYQPASGAVEQIARLRRTVAELAAQVAAQRDSQQRPTSLFPPPVRPVANVERPAPRTGTSRAFWERSYINRLYRWSRQ